MPLLLTSSKRGQVLSYDAIGGVVIFLIAVSILVTYWSSLSASFSDDDAVMVLEANTALDNLMSSRMLLEPDNYHVNVTKFKNCYSGVDPTKPTPIDKEQAGIFHDYFVQVIKEDGSAVPIPMPSDVSAIPGDGCGSSPIGKMPTSLKSIAVAERLAYFHEGNDDVPVKVVLRVYIQ